MALSYGTGFASGDIDVENTGDLVTSGASSHGIVASSRVFTYAGAASADAGNISIINHHNSPGGIITTSGTASSAIFAESISELGSGGTIDVINGLTSTVACDANGCTAVHLESSGATGGDDITVVNDDIISGGQGGQAIELIEGADNKITNGQDPSLQPGDAVISTKGGIYDTVISGTTGNDAIENLNGGIITGNLRMGTGVNSLLNDSDATYNSGDTVDLGGGTFTNNAFFSPGTVNGVMSASNDRRIQCRARF